MNPVLELALTCTLSCRSTRSTRSSRSGRSRSRAIL